MDTSQVTRVTVMTFLTQFYFLLGHPASTWGTYHQQQQPLFLPGPQHCPDTGRTVCTAVDYYPTDQIFHLLMSTRSQVFNLTSLFVDERKGDIEPNLPPLPTPQPVYQDGYGNSQPPYQDGYGNSQPPYQDGYGNSQPPYQDGYDSNQPRPGGPFPPTGYNEWNTQTSNKPATFSGLQPDRWRLVANTPNNDPENPRTPYTPETQIKSRAQVVQNPQGNNADINPSNPQRINYNDQPKLAINPNVDRNVRPFGNGISQSNGIDTQPIIPFREPQQFGNVSLYYPRNVNPQDPYQIHPPQIQPQYRVKGRNPYSGVTSRSQTARYWKGSPNPPDKPVAQASEIVQSSEFSDGRRERRNEDVEQACQVRSTYIPPRAALNDNSEWRYVINVPERDLRFTQVIKVDLCLNAGQPCSSRLSLPFGFESRCKQKYIKKKLLSLNPDGQGTSEDNFFIPSCCVCEISRPNVK